MLVSEAFPDEHCRQLRLGEHRRGRSAVGPATAPRAGSDSGPASARPSPRRTGRRRTPASARSPSSDSAANERQVELRRPPLDASSGSQRQPRRPQGRQRRVLQHEHHLEERRAGAPRGPAAAPRPASRTAGPGARRPPSAACRTRPSSSRKLGSPERSPAHHQRVDEEADQPLQLRPGPARDRRAHRDVVLAV